MRRTPSVLSVSAVLLLSACSAGDDPTLSAGSTDPSPTATASATAPSSPSQAPAAEPTDEPAAAGDTGLSTGEPSGGPLTVTQVRVARQDGFDRVVFELDGEQVGEPGWRVEYVDDPRRDGSGDPVELDGNATLVVLISGTGYPFDTGREEVTGVELPADLEVVTDVELGAVFEGTYEAFLGLSGERPFTVTRMADPARIAIDISHP